MTERNTDGTFAASEVPTGRDAVERDQGYTPMSPPETPPASNDGVVDDQIRLEADRLKSSRASTSETDITEVAYLKDGERVDPKETVTLERAADDLGNYHAAQDAVADVAGKADVARFVDSVRAEALAENPDIAKDLGLSKEEVAAAKAVEAEPSTNEAPDIAQQAEADPYADIDGLDEPTRQAMKVPQIREAVEREFSKAEETKQAYATGLDTARMSVMATLAEVVPHLAHLPPADFEKGLQVLSQADPPAFNKAMNIINRGAQIIEAQRQARQHEAAAQRQSFETWRNEQNALIQKALPLSYAEKAEFADDLTNYVAKFGVTRENIVQAMESNPLMHAAAFQDLIYKGIQYDKMMKAPKPRVTRENVPLNKPGTAAHRPSDNSSMVSSLQRQLANATTQQQQLKIGAQLLRAKRG